MFDHQTSSQFPTMQRYPLAEQQQSQTVNRKYDYSQLNLDNGQALVSLFGLWCYFDHSTGLNYACSQPSQTAQPSTRATYTNKSAPSYNSRDAIRQQASMIKQQKAPHLTALLNQRSTYRPNGAHQQSCSSAVKAVSQQSSSLSSTSTTSQQNPSFFCTNTASPQALPCVDNQNSSNVKVINQQVSSSVNSINEQSLSSMYMNTVSRQKSSALAKAFNQQCFSSMNPINQQSLSSPVTTVNSKASPQHIPSSNTSQKRKYNKVGRGKKQSKAPTTQVLNQHVFHQNPQMTPWNSCNQYSCNQVHSNFNYMKPTYQPNLSTSGTTLQTVYQPSNVSNTLNTVSYQKQFQTSNQNIPICSSSFFLPASLPPTKNDNAADFQKRKFIRSADPVVQLSSAILPPKRLSSTSDHMTHIDANSRHESSDVYAPLTGMRVMDPVNITSFNTSYNFSNKVNPRPVWPTIQKDNISHDDALFSTLTTATDRYPTVKPTLPTKLNRSSPPSNVSGTTKLKRRGPLINEHFGSKQKTPKIVEAPIPETRLSNNDENVNFSLNTMPRVIPKQYPVPTQFIDLSSVVPQFVPTCTPPATTTLASSLKLPPTSIRKYAAKVCSSVENLESDLIKIESADTSAKQQLHSKITDVAAFLTSAANTCPNISELTESNDNLDDLKIISCYSLSEKDEAIMFGGNPASSNVENLKDVESHIVTSNVENEKVKTEEGNISEERNVSNQENAPMLKVSFENIGVAGNLTETDLNSSNLELNERSLSQFELATKNAKPKENPNNKLYADHFSNENAEMSEKNIFDIMESLKEEKGVTNFNLHYERFNSSPSIPNNVVPKTDDDISHLSTSDNIMVPVKIEQQGTDSILPKEPSIEEISVSSTNHILDNTIVQHSMANKAVTPWSKKRARMSISKDYKPPRLDQLYLHNLLKVVREKRVSVGKKETLSSQADNTRIQLCLNNHVVQVEPSILESSAMSGKLLKESCLILLEDLSIFLS